MELCGDLGVRVAQSEESQHVELALGEVVRWRSDAGCAGAIPAWPRDGRRR
jgi:hypothetical protein